MKTKNIRPRRLYFLSQILLLTLLSFSGLRAAGVDPGFSPALIKSGGGRAAVTTVQPDGKIISYGIFSAVSGVPVSTNVIRLNADGTLDRTFNAPIIGGTASVGEIQLQSNGKIIIVGNFLTVGDQQIQGIVRLNSNGSVDSSFNVPLALPGGAQDVEVLADDRLVIAAHNGIYRLTADGAFESQLASDTAMWRVAVQPDGKIIGAAGTTIRRYHPGGGYDTSFAPAVLDWMPSDIQFQTDGKILAGGYFTTVNGDQRLKMVRFNPNGTVDPTFNARFVHNAGILFKIIVLPDGDLLVGGKGLVKSDYPNNTSAWRLNPDGSADPSFNMSIPISILDMDLQNGKLILSGEPALANSNTRPMYYVEMDGTFDPTFQATFGVAGEGRKLYVQPDGKILAAGNFDLANNNARPGITRFNADGSVDTNFAPTFFLPEGPLTSIDVQPDGKIVTGALSISFDARRLNANGTNDIGFSLARNVNDMKVLSDGKVLVAGNNYLRRYNADGSQDNSFVVSVDSGPVLKIALQPDGKIIIVGSFIAVNNAGRNRIARLNADGTLDNTFNPPAGANNTISEIALQPNGQILVGGAFTAYDLANRPYLARLNPDGSLNFDFAPVLNNFVLAIRLQPDNKILIGGTFTSVNNAARGRIARLNPDGSLDPTLNPGTGADGTVHDIEIQTDGRILIAGAFSMVDGLLRYGIARLQNVSAGKTLFDYDGDRRADISVFRPSTNRWYVFKSSDATVFETTFGISGDVTAPADYDGDGKTDVGIFRPATGDWWYLSSLSGQQVFAHWGQTGDIPRPSDFDGDGKADYIVYRPSNDTWYRYGSSTSTSSNVTFGASGDKPVTGDFDGDGKSDVAIFRPSTGDWWWKSSVDGTQRATHWGISTDVPAPADYDGDGKTDFAVYRPSNGTWYVYNSSNNSSTILNFGLSEDKPVPADYDGDGKADIAVFRPSSGTWYLQRTNSGFYAQQFGVSTDVPTENAFVP